MAWHDARRPWATGARAERARRTVRALSAPPPPPVPQDLPERLDPDPEESKRMIQYEWLPEKITELRGPISSRLAELEAELCQLAPAIEARALGKTAMVAADGTMGELRACQQASESAPHPAENWLYKPPRFEPSADLRPKQLHDALYQSRYNLSCRRSLSCALAKEAAERHTVEDATPRQRRTQRPSKEEIGALELDANVVLRRSRALMLLTHDGTALDNGPITPEQVLTMAERLGIVLSQ